MVGARTPRPTNRTSEVSVSPDELEEMSERTTRANEETIELEGNGWGEPR